MNWEDRMSIDGVIICGCLLGRDPAYSHVLPVWASVSSYSKLRLNSLGGFQVGWTPGVLSTKTGTVWLQCRDLG